MGSNPSYFTGDPNRPVEQVSWYDAIAFCIKYTEQERAAGRLPAGWVYRLPTEAEWEYACRSGTTNRFSFGDDPAYAELGNWAWYTANSGMITHPVGMKRPNWWGLYDMHGNVWESCLDWYGTYPGGSVTDPKGPDTGSYRVFRGGCWGNSACRSGYRSRLVPSARFNFLGFRAVLAYAPDGFFGEPARITQAPASQLVMPGLTASFTVQASGAAPLLYQWYKDGAKLVASARLSGVDTATLTIANVAEGDVGAYTVDVWNDWGLERSSAANLNLSLEVPGFVWIPAGTFTMGSPDSEVDRQSNEGPQTVATLTHGFYVCQHEVTQGEYQAMMGSNPSAFQGYWSRPVEQVTWDEAINYCAKLTEQERTAGRLPSGWVYRLPTEAEWEYACRAGTTTRFSYGDDPGYAQLGNYAWYSSNSGGQTHEVGLKQPNSWGLYDMAGNVWEWCLDWYGTYPGGSVTDPKGCDSGSGRVVRGGCWNYAGGYCRSAVRSGHAPDDRGSYIGIRAVLAPGQP
jgi:formylglycine-generating enzyme required for sulfatase activity